MGDDWPGWTTRQPKGDDAPLLVRVKADRYTSIRLEVFAAPHPPRRPEAKGESFPLVSIVVEPTPRADVEWFARDPHPDSGYGAYDGRCGACASLNTLCAFLAERPIAYAVDEVHGEVHCQELGCGRVSRFSYDRDSS